MNDEAIAPLREVTHRIFALSEETTGEIQEELYWAEQELAEVLKLLGDKTYAQRVTTLEAENLRRVRQIKEDVSKLPELDPRTPDDEP